MVEWTKSVFHTLTGKNIAKVTIEIEKISDGSKVSFKGFKIIDDKEVAALTYIKEHKIDTAVNIKIDSLYE